MNYKIIRSKRKTASLRITKEGTVEVRCPLKLSSVFIEEFVHSKQEWIERHIAIRQQQNKQKTKFSLCYEDTILYRGKAYPILAQIGKQSGFNGSFFYLPPNLDNEQIKNKVIAIYKKLAKEYIEKRVLEYVSKMGVMPTAIKINSAKTRWGSCSGKNSLNFSWFLILAQDSVIDYVVVHELAHIIQHNHSNQFWAVVEQVLPDYKERRQGLKVLQEKLSEEDWSLSSANFN